MRRSVCILLTLLVLLCASGNLNATCLAGQPKARGIYVNGIHTSETSATDEKNLIALHFSAYAMAKGIARDPDCVDFVLSYNDTHGFWHDLLTDSRLESLDQSISKFNLWAEVEAGTNSQKTSVSTAVSFSDFVSKQVYDTELNRLLQNIQDAWTANRTAVVFVHSEGNYYANYAYQYFKNQGVKLPDPQKLVIVSLASPTGNLLDGRNAYVKTCTDLIRAVFGSLPYNFNEPNGCSIQFPVVKSDSVINNIYNEFVSLLTLNPQKIPGDHLMGHYLEDNSALNGRVMQLLNSSLPDGNCYTASCTWNSPTINSWEWDTATTNGAANPVFQGGRTNLTVASANPVNVPPGGTQFDVSSQVRSLRQFSDNFTLQVKFLHGGTGASQIRLERATDGITAAGFAIYPLAGGLVLASVFSSTTNQVLTSTPDVINKVVTLTFTTTGGKIKISLTDSSGTSQIGELPWDNSNSYRLVVQSLIGMFPQIQNNVLYLNSVLVDRTDVVVIPPPTLTPSCSVNPAAITAGQSAVFTGSYSGGTGAVTGGWGGVVLGSGLTATYTTTASTPAGFGKATYTVTDSGSPKQTATANCQVQINAPVVSTSLLETFTSPYASSWNVSISGSPTIVQTNGDLTIRAGKSGNSASFSSKALLSGNISAAFSFTREFFGRTWIGLYSEAKQSHPIIMLVDTNDWPYMESYVNGQPVYHVGVSNYLNRLVKFEFKISGAQVQTFADGNLLSTNAFDPSVCPCRLAFAVNSVAWKSGDNLSHFKNITATAGSIIGPVLVVTVPPAPLVPTIGAIGITGTAVANTPFDLTVTNGNNIVTGQVQAWVFDTGICVNGCRHPDAGTINVSSGGLTLHNVQLAAGAHYLKLRNTDSGAWSNASTEFNVATASQSGFSEDFTIPYQSNWGSPVTSGNPVISQTPGDLRIQAPRAGSSAQFNSNAVFGDNLDVSFTLNHQGFGRTSMYIRTASTSQYLAGADLDTNDTAYLNFSSGSQSTQYKYNSASYMNRKMVLRIAISGNQVRFYTDGTLMETMPFTGSVPYRLYFAVGSVSWKSGDNITDLFGITATAGSVVIPTTGTIGVTTSGYNGSITCALNGSNFSAPANLTGKPAGSYALSCTAPPSYTISSISPSSSQTLLGGGTVNFAVNLTATITTGTVKVLATMNGQTYSGAMACGFLNSPSNILVNSVPFSQSNLSLGTYNLSCAGGPPNSQLQSFYPSSSQTLTAGGTITFTAVYVWTTVTVYSNPLPTPSGSYTWNLSAWQWSGSSWIIQPVLNVAGVDYRFGHPAGYIEALKQIKGWGATGPLDTCISQFQAALPYWPPYVVVSSGSSATTVSGYYWNNTPQNNVLFSGNISGNGFVSGNSAVYFCVNNTATCYQHPAVGVAVNSSISLSVYNVKLTTGYWQAKIQTPNGTGIGPAFYVQ